MVVLGRITAPYGVQGWLRLHPFGDDPERWQEIERWWLGREENDFSGWRDYPLQAMRLHGKGWVVKLKGVDDRSGAESLVGLYFGAPRDALPVLSGKLEHGEYYWSDLIGLSVVNLGNEPLGRVANLLESGAHAVLVVTEDGSSGEKIERLLPFVAHVVKEVDVPAGLMRVDWEKDW
jgi:16S rRNA processing protein RimM